VEIQQGLPLQTSAKGRVAVPEERGPRGQKGIYVYLSMLRSRNRDSGVPIPAGEHQNRGIKGCTNIYLKESVAISSKINYEGWVTLILIIIMKKYILNHSSSSTFRSHPVYS